MRNRLLTSERALPDNDMPLKQARDFILNSLLARRALCSQCLSGKLSIFLQDLIEEIYRLSVSCHMPEFTDHGLSHLCSLIERISSWTLKGSDRLVDNIEPDDAARLLLATLIHDLGMLSQKAKHLPADVPLEKQKALSPNISDWVRRTHVDRLPELFKSVIDELDFEFLGEEQKFIDDVIIIATSHDKWPWEWGFEDKGQRFLAGIVSVIDLLDEDSARCDTMTLIKHRDGNELNKAHWIRHCLTPERITINESHIRIALVKPSDWQDTIRLEPVLGALRNHFRLIKLYDTVLHSDRFDASLEIDFPNPEERSKELNGWQDIEGFESENAFCFQLLNTFMKPALNVIKEEDKTYFQHIPLEDVNLSLFNAINGKTPRHIIEKTFLALMDNEYNKAYKYLKKQTLEAHLSGDAYKVIYLCQVGIENLKSSDGLRLHKFKLHSQDKFELSDENEFSFNDWHWSFSLLIYWYTDSFQYTMILDKINAISLNNSEEAKLLLTYKNFLYAIIELITDNKNEISNLESSIEEFKVFFNLAQDEDVALIVYSSELVFVKSEDKKQWEKYHITLQNIFINNVKIYKALKLLYERLCWQFNVFWGSRINEFKHLENSDELGLAEGFKYSYNMDMEKLGIFLDKYKHKKDISIESPGYIPFFQLRRMIYYYPRSQDKPDSCIPSIKIAEYDLSMKKSMDDLVVNDLTKKNDSGDIKTGNQDLNSYIPSIEIAKYDLSMKKSMAGLMMDDFIKKIDSGDLNTGNRDIGLFVQRSYQLMIYALRYWSIYHFRSSCEYLREYFKTTENADKTILYWLMSGEKISKNDPVFRRVAFEFDNLDPQKREFVFQYILGCSNYKAYRAHELIEVFADAIPCELLPQFADWTIKLEDTNTKTTGHRLTWLEFWADIFMYANPQNENVKVAIDKLSDLILQKLEHPVFMQLYWQLVLHLIRNSNYEKGSKFIEKLKTINNNNSYRWTIIYNACRNNAALLNDNIEWLKNNSDIEPVCEVWVFTSISTMCNNNSVDQNLYNARNRFKDNVIASTTNKLNSILDRASSESQSRLEDSHKNVELIEWNRDSLNFIDLLVKVYVSRNATSLEKWDILKYLSNIFKNCSSEVVDKICIDLEKLLNPEDFYLECGDKRYHLISAMFNLCDCLLKNGNVSVQAKEQIKQILAFVCYIDNVVYLDSLFSLNIYFALTSLLSVEKSLFMSKAMMIIFAANDRARAEMDSANYKINDFLYETQIVAIIHRITAFIMPEEVPVFWESLKSQNDSSYKDVIVLFKTLLKKFKQNISPDIRAAVGHVLSRWEATNSSDFDDELKDMLTKLRQDSRLRVQFACSVKVPNR